MPRDIDNDLKKFKDEFVSNFSKIITSESKSDGEVSVYEIDIVGYDNPKGENNDLKVTRVQKKKKRKIEASDLIVNNEDQTQSTDDFTSNSMSKTDYPLLEALTRPNLNSVAYEIHIDKQPNMNGSQRCTWKIKSDAKSSSLETDESDEPPTDSDDKFKSQMRKRIIEDFLTKNNFKFKSAIHNLKKLDNGSVHLHHHEHHHHYYLTPSKALEIKNLLSKMQSSKTVDSEPEPKQKKKKDSDKKEQFAVSVPDTGALICQNATDLMEQKSDPKKLENFTTTPAKQRNSSALQGSSSIDSFLGIKSEVLATQTFSQAGFSRCVSKSVSNETINEKDEFKQAYLQSEPKHSNEMRSQKTPKSDYSEIMESLKVLDKYLEPKMITSTKTKISYLKCTCPTEANEQKMDETQKRTAGEEIISEGNENLTDGSAPKTHSNSVEGLRRRVRNGEEVVEALVRRDEENQLQCQYQRIQHSSYNPKYKEFVTLSPPLYLAKPQRSESEEFLLCPIM